MFQLRILMSKLISLKRFIEGGAAMLFEVKRNHHSIRLGKIERAPRVKKILRV